VTRSLALIALLLVCGVAIEPATAAQTCPHPESALGVSRIVEVDTKSGPLFGAFSKYEKEPRFLGPKEVVLTFDDGPLPRYTKPILEALDKFCTKATFFYVGEMAMAYPGMVKEVVARGHTVGSHTWSHPMNLRRQGIDRAKDQIERGFAAVALAADKPIAPFFRFPGLSDSGPMLAYLQERGIAAFTVDVVSNDSYIGSPQRLTKRTLDLIEKQNGGIVLFHDIKASTAKALPGILAELKKRGYKIVLLRPKSSFTPLPELTTELEAKRAKKEGGKPKLLPFYAAIAPTTLAAVSEPEVTELAPPTRERTHAGGTHATASQPVTTTTDGDAKKTATRRHRSRGRRVHRKKTVTGAYDGAIPSLSKVVSGVH
jgi:peptidoglycan/xylan/chitin deacetylase (PgdA/CDA1 family)